MGKKKGKKVDLDKKAALAARREAKAEKAEQKRVNKEARKAAGEDVGGSSSSSDDDDSDKDMDQLLETYKQQDQIRMASMSAAVRVVACDGFPPARANATLTVTSDTKKKDAYLFGGEYYNGIHNVVSDQLFKLDLSNFKWKQIVTSVTPPPRCAHSTAYYNKHLYVFGGEFADKCNSDFSHYKDTWKFDTNSQVWTEIKGKGGPSPRSGHAVTLWKHYMIVFGGFYEGSKDQAQPRWFNDIHVLNLQTEQWLDIPYSKLTVRPEPRSACNHALIDHNWIIQGGFTKLLQRKPAHPQQPQHDDDAAATMSMPKPETKVHTDAWILNLQPLLDTEKPPVWERCTSSISSLQKQLEAAAETACGRSGVGSVLYNKNMLLFGGVVDQEMHHHKLDSIFYNDLSLFHFDKRKFLPLRVNSTTMNTTPRPGGTTGWDLQKLRSDMFAFTDGAGNIIYEKTGAVATEQPPKDSTDKIVQRSEPLPRIKPCLFMDGNTLYVYGGLLEVGDREVTLDDMWSIDLRKKQTWLCIFPGTMHMQVWKGAVHDDDDSYYSASVEGDREEELSEKEEGEEKKLPADSSTTDTSKSAKREIAGLIDKYRLEDENQTPHPEEAFDDFYTRTKEYWSTLGKDASQTGYELAKTRFSELRSVIERIMTLQLERKQQKKERKAEKKECQWVA